MLIKWAFRGPIFIYMGGKIILIKSFLLGALPSFFIGFIFVKLKVEIPCPAGWEGTLGAIGVLVGYQLARIVLG